MEIDPDDASMYRTLSSAVIPRPIAWVSSRSNSGVDNLAPFSFFTVACVDPPILAFAPLHFHDELKDTPRNAVETKEFAVNVVVEEQVDVMSESSATIDEGESEFEHAGIDAAECTIVNAPRVVGAPVTFECRLYDAVEFPTSTLVLGEVVNVHVDESVLTDGKLDVRKILAVGRLAGGYYARTSDRFSIDRPE